MITQICVALLALCPFTAFGLPVAALLRDRSAGVALSVPVFGLALFGVIGTLLYALGIGPTSVAFTLLGLAGLFTGVFARLWLPMLCRVARCPAAAVLVLLGVGAAPWVLAWPAATKPSASCWRRPGSACSALPCWSRNARPGPPVRRSAMPLPCRMMADLSPSA